MQRKTIYVDDYEAAVRKGRSQGSGSDYIPGLFVRDTASCATSTRLWSSKFGRMVQLLSHGEVNAFLQFEWLPTVTDIREQFFLDPTVTQAICKKLNLIHPNVRGRNIVMTTDFVVTREKDGKRYLEAYQVKRRPEDLTPRTKAKLKVEYLYWKSLGVKWAVLYSERFNQTQCANLKRLHVWQRERLSVDDAAQLISAFRSAKRICPNLTPGEIVLSPFHFHDGQQLRFAEGLMTLAAHHFVEFPIKDIDFMQCPMNLFTEFDHAA